MIARARVPVTLGLIVVGYLLLGFLYATRVPIWNTPDEPAHYNFIYSIAVQHQLPTLEPGDYDQQELAQLMHDHFPPGVSVADLRYESHQPPLYYAIAAPVLAITEGRTIQTQVVALRLVTVVLGALLILASYRLASSIFKKSMVGPLAVAAFVAFVPMHVFMDAAIDNDALAELLVCVTLIVLVDNLRVPSGSRAELKTDILVGVLVGLCALTKLVADVSALLVILALLLAALLAADNGRALRRLPLRYLRSGAIAVALSGWWFARNVVIYGLGDPFGLRRHAEVVVGQPLTGAVTFTLARDMSLTVFHSFWGQFGWMGIPYADRTYDVIAALSTLVFLGVLLMLRRVFRSPMVDPDGSPVVPADPRLALVPTPGRLHPFGLAVSSRPVVLLLAAEIVLVAGGVIFYNLRYYQPQGRYFFPALPALAVLAAAGIAELIDDAYVGLVLTLAGVALFAFSAWSLFSVILPGFN